MAKNLTPSKAQGGGLATRQDHHPVDLFRREMDSLFNRFFGGWMAPFEEDLGLTRGWGFDVDEDDKEIVVRADVPGFEENDLDVRLDGNRLTIKAEKEQKGDDQRGYRSFFRQVTLPSGIDADKAQASYRNGVLELHIPRSEGSRPRRIAIQGQQARTGAQAGTGTPSARGGNGAHAGQPAAAPTASK